MTVQPSQEASGTWKDTIGDDAIVTVSRDFAKLGPHNLAREEAGASEFFLSLWFQLTLAFGRELPLFLVISRIFGTQRLSPEAEKRRPDVAYLSCCLDRGGLEPPTLGSFGSLPRARRAFVPTELPAHDPQNLVSSYLLWEISSVSLRGRVVKLRCWRCGGIHRWKGEGKMRAFVQLALSISLSRWFYSSPATPLSGPPSAKNERCRFSEGRVGAPSTTGVRADSRGGGRVMVAVAFGDLLFWLKLATMMRLRRWEGP